eukprot:symbB.v1.2.013474.t1/scaffold954.1/size149253/1
MSGPKRWAQTRLGRLLGHHYAFVVTRWGFGKSMATLLARAGSQKLALGAVATGATGLTIHHNTKERHFGSDVLSSEQEVEWLNAAIKPIWDHLDAGVHKIIEDEIRPALQQRLGRMGNYLQFTQLTLGSASPRFGPVRVTRSDHGLEINAGFSLEGNGMLEFSAGVASLQVCDITIQGSLRLGLQPLLDSLNPVGGVSITCLDRPIIDLTIKTGGEMFPNLYNFVRETVDDVVADLIVIPNMVAVPIDASTDACALRHPLPLGFLRVSLDGITAAGPLPSTVYVEVFLGCQVWKSGVAKVSSYSRHVEWLDGNVKDLEVFSQDQLLRFRVFSTGSFSSVSGPSLLASGQVFIRDLMPGRVEVPLTDADAHEETSEHAENSSVELFLSWLPVQPEPPTKADEDFLASVHLKHIVGLQELHMAAREDPHSLDGYRMRITAGGSSRLTPVGVASPAVHEIAADRFLVLARKLWGKMSLVDLADALNIPVSHARAFALEHQRRQAQAGKSGSDLESWDIQWCKEARDAAHRIAAMEEPHFDHVSHLRVGKEDVVLIELLDQDVVIARLERSLKLMPKGGCEGPFHLIVEGCQHPCTLHGRVELRRIESPVRTLWSPAVHDTHNGRAVRRRGILPKMALIQ